MKIRFFIFFIFLCGQFGAANAQVPLDRIQMNANPFVRIHALPGYSAGEFLSAGQASSQVDLEITNEFHLQSKADEEVYFDYERTQLNLSFQYGITDDLSVGVNLPYISNSGGFMDGLIENWHDLFGLQQGGRDDSPRDQFIISYQNTEQSLRLDNSDQGIGDISLFLNKRIIDVDQHKLKARASIKLPTGDDDQLFGSGGYGFSMSLNGSKQFADKWQAFGMVGLSYLQDGHVLPNLQTNLVGSAVVGIGWQFKPRFGLSVQLDLNSEVYDGADVDAINGQAGVLNFSANYRFSEKTILSFGFNEDVIHKDAAPDFGINLAFRYQH